MDAGIIAVCAVGAACLLVMGFLSIRAAIPTKQMLENAEYSAVKKKGYGARKRQLQRHLILSCSMTIIFAAVLVWVIPVTVDDFMNAPYSFERHEPELAWWPPIVLLGALAGGVVFLVMWVRTARHLRVLKSIAP